MAHELGSEPSVPTTSQPALSGRPTYTLSALVLPIKHADLQATSHKICYRALIMDTLAGGRRARFAGACRELDAAGATALVAFMAPGR